MKTEEIVAKQKEFVMPCTPLLRQPLVYASGQGALVKDIEGKEYIDCFGGYAVVNMGHCHPKVVRAIQEQAGMVWHTSYDYYNLPMTRLAEKLAEVAPSGLKKTFFCCSGAEAVEGAVKLAKKYASRHGRLGSDMISLSGSFHGRTALTVALTGQKKYKKGMGNLVGFPGIVHAPVPYCYRCPFGLDYPDCGVRCATFMEDIISFQTSGDIAAFISEPLLGEGGILVPPEEYLSTVVKIFRSHSALYIADEVQSGFGRTGKMFGVEWYGVQPDVMTMGKGIAGGLPIAAFIAKSEVADAFEPGDHSSTYGGNALMCAAALANIQAMIDEQVTDHAMNTGNVFIELLDDLKSKHPIIGDVRGKGLMIGVELVRDRKSREPAVEEAKKLRDMMREKGAIIGAGGLSGSTLRLQPPLVITEEQVKKVCSTLDHCLQSL